LDNTPRTRSQVAPAYPASERNAGISGEVLVEFTVDESGRVLNPRVVRSSRTAFESPTLRAVSNWRFEPGKKNGQAVRFRMMVPVAFNLESN
jgi:protein TonB